MGLVVSLGQLRAWLQLLTKGNTAQLQLKEGSPEDASSNVLAALTLIEELVGVRTESESKSDDILDILTRIRKSIWGLPRPRFRHLDHVGRGCLHRHPCRGFPH